ncbi:hypothetical protein M432DRAFT_232206 [Thermoascus aurantiacus ATCC 26904]
MEASGALRRRVHRAQLNTRRWGAWRETTTAPRRSAVIVASRPMRMPEAVGVGWGWLGQESSAAPACESAVHQVWMIMTMTSMLCQKHSARLSCEGAGSQSGTTLGFVHPSQKRSLLEKRPVPCTAGYMDVGEKNPFWTRNKAKPRFRTATEVIS